MNLKIEDLDIYAEAAKNGNKRAIEILINYKNEYCLKNKNIIEAIKHIAENEKGKIKSSAQIKYGDILYDNKDPDAIIWYKKAADSMDINAFYKLVNIYDDGDYYNKYKVWYYFTLIEHFENKDLYSFDSNAVYHLKKVVKEWDLMPQINKVTSDYLLTEPAKIIVDKIYSLYEPIKKEVKKFKIKRMYIVAICNEVIVSKYLLDYKKILELGDKKAIDEIHQFFVETEYHTTELEKYLQDIAKEYIKDLVIKEIETYEK